MTASEETIINSHDVLNQLVLDVRTTEEVGRVSSIQIDPQTHQVLGLTCKLGLLGRKKNTLPFSLIQTFGKDSVLVQLSEDAELGLPESASSLIGHQLWTDAGHNAGKVVSYRFNAKTGAITDYLFVSNGWQGVADGVYQFPVSAITSVGPKRIIAVDSVVKGTEQYAPGLTQKMAQAADFLKEDYKQTQQDMAGAVRGGQNIFEQAKQKAGEVAGQVKQKAGEVAGQAKDKAGELAEQAKDKTGQLQGKAQELAVQAKQKAGEVAEQAKDKAGQLQDKAQELAAQAKDKAGELTEQAKDKTGQLQGKTQELAAQAQDQAEELADQAKDIAHNTQDQAEDVARTAQEQVSQIENQTQREVTNFADAVEADATEAIEEITRSQSTEP